MKKNKRKIKNIAIVEDDESFSFHVSCILIEDSVNLNVNSYSNGPLLSITLKKDHSQKLFENYKLPELYINDLPLIKKRKTHDEYSYILFKQGENRIDSDVRLIMEDYSLVVCISETIMEDICNSGIKGCQFTKIKGI